MHYYSVLFSYKPLIFPVICRLVEQLVPQNDERRYCTRGAQGVSTGPHSSRPDCSLYRSRDESTSEGLRCPEISLRQNCQGTLTLCQLETFFIHYTTLVYTPLGHPGLEAIPCSARWGQQTLKRPWGRTKLDPLPNQLNRQDLQAEGGGLRTAFQRSHDLRFRWRVQHPHDRQPEKRVGFLDRVVAPRLDNPLQR